MTISLDVQIISKSTDIPDQATFECWAKAIPTEEKTSACLRVVDEAEAKDLNRKYRKIDKATNVLSFPAEIPPQVEINYLGDIVICAQVVVEEAQNQNKRAKDHWAHLLVHGLLHLQGYDHEDDQSANAMENLEVKILNKLQISNPYI